MLLRLAMVAWKEFIQIGRDRRMLGVSVVLPVFMVMLYGYAINLDVKHLRIGILDHDRTDASRALIEAFANTEYFSVTDRFAADREIEPALITERVRGALVIPRGFGRDLARRRTVPVQFIIDGSDSTSASTVVGYVSTLLAGYSNTLAVQAVRRAGVGRRDFLPIDNRFRNWYNPELRSNNFIVPGLIAVVLMMLSALLTSVTIVREKERGSFENLIVSPVTAFELVLGKLLPYVVIAFGDVLLVLLTSHFLFAIPFRGSLAVLFLLSGVFLTAALGIGLLISAKAPTQQMANMAAMVGTQLPAVLLSGFMFPITSIPESIQWIPTFIPATHFIRILRSLFLKGSPLSDLLLPAGILLGFGLVMIVASARSFKKKLE